MDWHVTEYGADEAKIEVLILSELLENVLVGMISSLLFKENIAIAIDHQKTLDYDFACLGRMSDGSKPRIYMERELVEKLRNGCDEAKFILFHEIGHYVYSNQSANKCDSNRESLVQNGAVSKKELLADDFAASYIGRDVAIRGLEQLSEDIKDKKQADVDEYALSLALREVELRINHQRTKQ